MRLPEALRPDGTIMGGGLPNNIEGGLTRLSRWRIEHGFALNFDPEVQQRPRSHGRQLAVHERHWPGSEEVGP